MSLFLAFFGRGNYGRGHCGLWLSGHGQGDPHRQTFCNKKYRTEYVDATLSIVTLGPKGEP